LPISDVRAADKALAVSFKCTLDTVLFNSSSGRRDLWAMLV